MVVKSVLNNDYKVVKSSRVEALEENRGDKYRAAVSQEIGAAYDIAVATLNGDIQRDLIMNSYGNCLKINKDTE